ncbi:MAG: hypothetical protein A4S17_06270 [Proteobacteria bacterium HN_bin10]|nr:MAG: hypothetical protein A4S17_06270 [Proteobacteria bacterium HN_bin10]
MSEADVIAELVEFTNILMVGVSLIFSIVSAYVVALNYFIGSANFLARLGSFLFITLVLGMLMVAMLGAQATHIGLIARLTELRDAGELTAAGRAVLANATQAGGLLENYSVDDVIRLCVWGGLGFVYLALGYLTFLHKWTPDAIPVTIEQGERR